MILKAILSKRASPRALIATLGFFGVLAAPIAAQAAIRLLVPQGPYSQAADKELASVVEQYNRLHTGADPAEYKVELLRRGESFSSLKELVASYLAGDVPELAAVEASEIAALTTIGKGALVQRSLSFRVTVPILVADQEMLFRVHANPEHLPQEWPALTRLAEQLAQNNHGQGKDSYALALPLQGALGLWIFEALGGEPLWQRETGGIRNNRELSAFISQTQRLIDHAGLLRSEENWEHAIQAFIDRKTPLLVTSLDLLPYITKQAAFRWTATLLPVGTKAMPLQGGSSLVITRDSPGVRSFLKFLYAKENTARWLGLGGFLPDSRDALNSSAWKKVLASQPAYARIVTRTKQTRPRTTDKDVVRAHSEWVQALRLLFSDAAHRLPTESALTQMDSHLTLQ